MTDTVHILDNSLHFPALSQATIEPDGLLAIGGDLSRQRLLKAYSKGIFPWFCEDEPILWWSPNPRCIIPLDELHISKSMKRFLKKSTFKVTLNHAFSDVIASCALPRTYEKETWILPEMQQAYIHLHEYGAAHSVEVWDGDELVGGIYGVSLGKFFFGESMFSKRTNTSKMAIIYLVNYLKKHDFLLLDCQVGNPHLYSLGAKDMLRDDFSYLLEHFVESVQPDNLWTPQYLEL